MTRPDPKQIKPDCPLTDDAHAAVAALARRQHGAQGLLMKLVTALGGQVETGLKAMPAPVRDRVNDVARAALTRSYELAARSHEGAWAGSLRGDRAHKVAATVSGAVGGVGGLATSLIELPVATTMIFRSIQQIADRYGEDPHSEETRLECLQVFGAGAPGEGDDGVDTAFLGARLGVTGSAVHGLISKIAPRVAAVLGQKLASQTVPVIGAIAGAGTNYAFVDYYTEIAHVHFGLKRLMDTYDEDQVLQAFHEELARLNRPLLRA